MLVTMRQDYTVKPDHQKIVQKAFVALVASLALAIFFRNQILNNFAFLFGDRYDSEIELSILEHWFNVIRGMERWDVVSYFYPHGQTLGYNDGYFLYGLIYSVFRTARFDPWLASELVDFSVKTIGFFGFYLFCRDGFDFSRSWSAFGAFLFTIANNTAVIAMHAQVLSVAFAPWMAWFLVRFIMALGSQGGGRVLFWGISAAVLYAGWLLTAFYMAWFFFYFGLAFALCSIPWLRLRQIRAAWQAVRSHYWSLLIVCVVIGLSIAPFLWVYLPKARETGMHPWEESLKYISPFFDVLNVGAGNLLFGRLDQLIDQTVRPHFSYSGKHNTGLPAILVGLFLIAVFWTWVDRRARRTWILPTMASAALLTWMLTLHFGDFTGWRWVYSFVPGAKATRVVARYQIFVVWPVLIVAVGCLSAFARGAHAWSGRGVIIGVLCALLVAEEINVQMPLMLDRAAERQHLATISPPPGACRSFFASAARAATLMGPGIDDNYSHNVDAMVVSEYFNIPTVNGISTFTPPDWNFYGPAQPDYLVRVHGYATAHKLDGLCGLDLQSGHWSTDPFTE